MKLLALCLALAAVPVIGQPRLARAAPITLYTQFQEAPPVQVLGSLEAELGEIMSPMGLQFDWRPLAGPRGKPSVELAVVTFKGRCDVSGLLALDSAGGPLGWTHVSDGVILPFSDVDCDQIRTFVQLQLLHIKKGSREAAYGRAVGRVLAHELYHIFANTQQHSSEGVAKAAYTVRELLDPVFHFQDREAKELRIEAGALLRAVTGDERLPGTRIAVEGKRSVQTAASMTEPQH